MRFKEIETKYSAKAIQVEDFLDVTRAIPGVERETTPESYDHYHHNGRAFLRHRDCVRDPQLTAKEKTSKRNSFNRREANVHLAPGVDSKDAIAELANILKMDRKFSIFKCSHIVWYEKFNTVYYVIYSDADKKKEIGRFVEIEMSEEYPWDSEKQAWKLLLKIEKRFKSLGISPRKRLKKNLFEMYRNGWE